MSHTSLLDSFPAASAHGQDTPELHLHEQFRLLSEFALLDKSSYLQAIHNGHTRYVFGNQSFCLSDALALHSMVRHLQPKRIIEIGCGMSSNVILDTNDRFLNGSIQCSFIDISSHAFKCRPEDRELHTFICAPVQEVPLSVFSQLEAGDILFIDSSHIYAEGSDVHDLFHRVLPSLPDGVVIHIHDIFHMWDYPAEWKGMDERKEWNEIDAVRRFLLDSAEYSMMLFLSHLKANSRNLVTRAFGDVQDYPGSLWLRKGGQHIDDSPPLDQTQSKPRVSNKEVASPFVIFFTERSGSTHLVSLLQSHPQIRCYHELFGLPDSGDPGPQTIEQRRTLLNNVFVSEPEDLVTAAGFKMQVPVQTDYYPDLLKELRTRKDALTIITLRRQNVVRQALSTIHRNYWLEDRQMQPPMFALPMADKINVSPDGFLSIIAHYERQNSTLSNIAHEFPRRFDLTYEGLTDHENDTLQSLMHTLNVSPEWTLVSALSRVTPLEPEQWINNADELRSSLQGTPWQHMW